MSGRQSQTELHRIVEQALSRVGLARRTGLWLAIRHVTVAGRPIHTVRFAATLHFLATGSPYCCGEPVCHLGLSEGCLRAIGDEIRRACDCSSRSPSTSSRRWTCNIRLASSFNPVPTARQVLNPRPMTRADGRGARLRKVQRPGLARDLEVVPDPASADALASADEFPLHRWTVVVLHAEPPQVV